MKMENPRTAFLERNFPPFMRTASDPSRAAAQMVRKNKSLPQARSLSTSPENPNFNSVTSPQLQRLTRMDSYRVLAKQQTEVTERNGECKKTNLTVPQGKPPTRKSGEQGKSPTRKLGERRTVSNLGVERMKRKKEDRKLRSQSSPMFPPDLDVTDPNLGTSTDTVSNEWLRAGSSSFSGPSSLSNKSTPVLGRKISLMSIKDFNIKKLIDTKPKLNRSQSQKLMERPDLLKADDDEYDEKERNAEGPLFQATTLFVPGYDFKSKQIIAPLGSRKSSTPQLPRRSSKERMSVLLDKVITRQSSTPCLFKRDSKEKMKKIELQIDEKIVESPGPSEKEQANDDSGPGVAAIEVKKALITEKQKQFRAKGTSKTLDASSISPSNSVANVKLIASSYEDGSAFLKVKKLADSSLTRHNSCGYEITRRDGSVSDYSPRHKKNSHSWNSGMESGYASPTGDLSPERDTYANSWSHSNWTRNDELMFNNLSIGTRVFSKDLCVTEL